MDPALGKPALHDIFFDLLDRDRWLIDSENAGCFARRGTNPAGEFREIVGRVQLANGFSPTPPIDEIVPIGNQVVDGASGLAKGHATIHAARALGPKSLFRKIEVDLEPIIDPLRDWPPRRKFAPIFQESRVLTHVAPAHLRLARPAGHLGCRVDGGGLLRALVCVRAEKLL